MTFQNHESVFYTILIHDSLLITVLSSIWLLLLLLVVLLLTGQILPRKIPNSSGSHSNSLNSIGLTSHTCSLSIGLLLLLSAITHPHSNSLTWELFLAPAQKVRLKKNLSCLGVLINQVELK
jgi:hypothetical protein